MAGQLPPDAELAALYPPGWSLLLVQIVHRHGDRSAIFNPFRSIVWRTADGHGLCTASSPLHQLATNFVTAHDGITARPLPPVRLHFEDRHRRGLGTCLPGQLTDRGYERMWALGQRFRRLYVSRLGFLPGEYDPYAVTVKSTEIPRAIESAQAVIGGLFFSHPATPAAASRTGMGKASGPAQPNAKPADPIHIVVREEKSEYMYPSLRQCPRLRVFYEEMRRQSRERHRAELDSIREALDGQLLTAVELGGSPATAHDMYDGLSAARAHGVPMPAGITPEMYERIEHMAVNHWWTPYAEHPAAVRLGIGRLIGELVDAMDVHAGPAPAKAETKRPALAGTVPPASSSAPLAGAGPKVEAGPGISFSLALPMVQPTAAEKLRVYSGHDSTVAPLLAGLNVYDGRWPDFGSHVVLELLNIKRPMPSSTGVNPKSPAPASDTSQRPSETLAVRVFYDHHVVALPQCQEAASRAGLPTTVCPFDHFKALMTQLIPQDHHKECQLVAPAAK